MRVFAGPNGSGKSTLIKAIQGQFRTGPYINADDIEKAGRDKKFVNLGDFDLLSATAHFQDYLDQSTLLAKAREEGFHIDVSLSDNIIRIGDDTNSYEAALIADYLRLLLVDKGESFCFETVMSHPSKLNTFKRAQSAGFKNYLYFISTADPSINKNRVSARVKKGGHAVDPEKIEERYYRSMDLLGDMIPYCHRCFIIDNSGADYQLIVEVVDGETLTVHTDQEIPAWVDQYVFQKLSL